MPQLIAKGKACRANWAKFRRKSACLIGIFISPDGIIVTCTIAVRSVTLSCHKN